MLATGLAVAQEFVDWEGGGDLRVLVLYGAAIRVGCIDAAVHRTPPAQGFRSNVHAGGTATPAVLTDGQRATAHAAAQALQALGVRIAGLDLVGNKVIEVNVHSPGGLEDMSRFTGHNIVRLVARQLLQPRPSSTP